MIAMLIRVSSFRFHINKLRFSEPITNQFFKYLSDELVEQDIILKFSALEKLTALLLGYSTAEALITDSRFTQSRLSELSFFAYDESALLNDIKNLLDEEGYGNIDEVIIFDMFFQLFDFIQFFFIREFSHKFIVAVIALFG